MPELAFAVSLGHSEGAGLNGPEDYSIARATLSTVQRGGYALGDILQGYEAPAFADPAHDVVKVRPDMSVTEMRQVSAGIEDHLHGGESHLHG